MNPLDRTRQKRSNAESADTPAFQIGMRNRIRRHQFFNCAVFQFLLRRLGQQTVRNNSIDLLRPLFLEKFGGGAKRSGCGCEVIADHAVTPLDVTDKVGGFHGGRADAAFCHDSNGIMIGDT